MEDVAGYRVLRTAGRGGRAALHVGFADGETVVLKVTQYGDPGAAREVEALERGAGEHVVGLRDVDSDGRRIVLVLDRLERGSLADLLDRRRSFGPGEAVTILAPLADTIDRLHRAGVAHGRISPEVVCFGTDGSPTLVGFGDAELFAPGSPEVVLETVPGVIADRDALRRLVGLLVARVPEVDGQHLPATDAPPAELAAALFDLATPAPVRFDGDSDETVAAPRPVGVAETVVEGAAESDPVGFLPAWLAAVVPDALRRRLDEPLARIAAIWSAWGTARRRLVLGGAAGALTVLTLIAVVPPTASPVVTAAAPSPTPSTAPSAELPDDPLESAALLLAAREGCIRDLSVLCLDGVVQPGSAAAAADTALIRGLLAGGEYPVGAIGTGDLVLVERLGDSVLIDLPPGSSPASVLLLRTTNGWRLRQYFEIPGLEAPAVTTTGG